MARSPRSSQEVRLFWRAALARQEEAGFLFENEFYTAAIYLAGYAVECALKALLLCNEPISKHEGVLRSFHGGRGHDFLWLSRELSRRNVWFPDVEREALAEVGWWTTDLRYQPRESTKDSARNFLSAVELLVAWVGGKI